jgi:L-threonylcarbamoyladenylate synthase
MYHLKDRPVSTPTAIFIGSIEEITRYAEINAVAEQVAAAFLPGPLTLILRARTQGNAPVVVDGKIGLRISSSPVIANLVDACDFPLSATSANRSGAEENATIIDIAATFPEGIDLFLDAGNLELPPSTVVDCSDGGVRVVREGAVSREQIAAVVRKVNC